MSEPFRRDIDYYEVLQVHPHAHPAVIRKVYHVLMLELKNHPDLGGHIETAQLINEAFAVLSDPDRRRAYDRFRLDAGLHSEAPGAVRTGASAPAADPKVFQDLIVELEDAMTALSAWPPRRSAPLFCRGQVGVLEGGPLSDRFGFRFTGSLRDTQERFGAGMDFRTYAQPRTDVRMLVVAVGSTITAGLLTGPHKAIEQEGLVAAFAAEISGGGLDTQSLARLLHAVTYLDTGEPRRRTKAVDLWLACVTREGERTGLTLAAYPL
ncbi:MAG: DnaJ domain-containing protein [Armatimonadota bacterium]|nr:DnaJ domain-containing protein [Armatimonadota bacterium]